MGGAALALALTWPAAAQDAGRFSGPPTTFRTYSLDETPRTLIDPDEALNRQYTGQTAESLLELITAVTAEGFARMRSKAVDAEVAIPLGWHAIEDKVHVHDLHATILHLLGLEHTRLTWRHAGRDYRLTDVHGNVVHSLLA